VLSRPTPVQGYDKSPALAVGYMTQEITIDGSGQQVTIKGDSRHQPAVKVSMTDGAGEEMGAMASSSATCISSMMIPSNSAIPSK